MQMTSMSGPKLSSINDHSQIGNINAFSPKQTNSVLQSPTQQYLYYNTGYNSQTTPIASRAGIMGSRVPNQLSSKDHQNSVMNPNLQAPQSYLNKLEQTF